jgi:hypothetical protein
VPLSVCELSDGAIKHVFHATAKVKFCPVFYNIPPIWIKFGKAGVKKIFVGYKFSENRQFENHI